MKNEEYYVIIDDESTCANVLVYNIQDERLTFQYSNKGDFYSYYDISKNDFMNLAKSESIGKHITTEVKCHRFSKTPIALPDAIDAIAA